MNDIVKEVIREKSIEWYVNKIIEINPHHDRELLEKGISFMYDAHKEQIRISGKPYIDHTTSVGELLASEFNTNYVVAGDLHDVVEETKITVKEIKKKFGKEIGNLVDDMSIKGGETKEEHMDRIIKKKRAVPVKYADLIDNMRTSNVISKYGKESLLERAKYFLEKTKNDFANYKIRKDLENEAIKLEKSIKIKEYSITL